MSLVPSVNSSIQTAAEQTGPGGAEEASCATEAAPSPPLQRQAQDSRNTEDCKGEVGTDTHTHVCTRTCAACKGTDMHSNMKTTNE